MLKQIIIFLITYGFFTLTGYFISILPNKQLALPNLLILILLILTTSFLFILLINTFENSKTLIKINLSILFLILFVLISLIYLSLKDIVGFENTIILILSVITFLILLNLDFSKFKNGK
jgi:hypothetical protein